jgi:hypothetical protein
MGDMNSKVDPNNESLEQVMGIHGVGEMNENGAILSNFCASHDLVIGGTIFPTDCSLISLPSRAVYIELSVSCWQRRVPVIASLTAHGI